MLKFFAEKMWVAFAVQKLLTFFSKNIRILYIESAKTVSEMTLNELVKLTMLWTTGPWNIKVCLKWNIVKYIPICKYTDASTRCYLKGNSYTFKGSNSVKIGFVFSFSVDPFRRGFMYRKQEVIKLSPL